MIKVKVREERVLWGRWNSEKGEEDGKEGWEEGISS